MNIRTSQPADTAQITQLITRILASEFPKDQVAYSTEDLQNLTQSYQGPTGVFLIAEDQNKIVGTCGVKAEDAKTAILRRFFVDPAIRGKGIGTALLNEALAFCRKNGFKQVVIRTSAGMEKAIRLCQLKGFQPEGEWSLGGVTLVRYVLRVA